MEVAPETSREALEAQRKHVARHGSDLRRALSAPAPSWNERPKRYKDACSGAVSAASGSFATLWGAGADSRRDGARFELQLSLPGTAVPLDVFGDAVPDPTASGAMVLVRFFGVQPQGQLLVVQLHIPRASFSEGQHKFHGLETVGSVGVRNATGEYSLLGMIGDGSITLERAGKAAGAAVTGRFQGQMYQAACAKVPVSPGD
jgi:hypothetical protein